MNPNGQWDKKYEPTSVDEMVLNPTTRDGLNYVINGMSSTILYGPPGCGKGTFVNLFIVKPHLNHMWINAAEESGIEIIRKKVRPYCYGGSSIALGTKHMVFNEADKLSEDAQICLREIVEMAPNTRFIFMTNNIDKIQHQIRSRCFEVEYKRPPEGDVVNFIKEILIAESLEVDPNKVQKIVGRNYPDIRSTIIETQAVFSVA
jgi:DNA polymerase III delta prime subunit